jgi:hypothetical protein
MSSAYVVGYKKPPASGQYKKGKSGNPAGRPKGSTTLKGSFEKMLQQPVRLHEGGRQRSIPAGQAMFIALMKRAMSGETKAIELVTKLAEKFGVLVPAANDAERDPFGWTADDESLRPFIDHLIKGGKLSDAPV